MSLPVQQFPLLDFQQANPGLTAASSINQTLGQILQNHAQSIKNQYMPQTLQEALTKAKYQNQILAPEAQYAPQMTLANLQAKQMEAPYKQAQIDEILKGNIPLEQAQRGQALANTGYLGAETQKVGVETQKAKQMMDIIQGIMGPEQNKTNQGPITGNVNGISMTGPQLQAYQNIAGKQQIPTTQGQNNLSQMQQQPGVNMPTPQAYSAAYGNQVNPTQEKLLKLSDMIAAMGGKDIPSLKPVMKGLGEQAAQDAKSKFAYSTALASTQAKNVEDLSISSSNQAALAQQSIGNLNELLKYNSAATMKGPLMDYLGALGKMDPNYVAAMKSAAQLQLAGTKDIAASHVGRVLETMLDNIQRGLPTPNLPEEAVKTLAQQLLVANKMVIAKNNLIQKYKEQIPDAGRLNTGISNIMLKYNPVDDKGNLHPEMIDKWEKAATPERLQEASTGNTENLPITKTLGGKNYIKINGQWHEQ